MTPATTTHWQKSSYSNGMGGECVEVAVLTAEIAVRDSKVLHGPRITLSARAWTNFVNATGRADTC
ncbi:DUF397 domain-containing protein [Streptomyces sp. NBC_01361]|uniref:DUF397 domain-containing protein n=1 Tax=Streptomyces sp. NBC_01361 TaxID=2903838 RepID=UPI002E301E4C|nr:DUF397 domain-containing protein [Streptomyces sp. NBC_01361]